MGHVAAEGSDRGGSQVKRQGATVLAVMGDEAVMGNEAVGGERAVMGDEAGGG